MSNEKENLKKAKMDVATRLIDDSTLGFVVLRLSNKDYQGLPALMVDMKVFCPDEIAIMILEQGIERIKAGNDSSDFPEQ